MSTTQRAVLKKQSLKPSTKPMTSVSSTQPLSTKGEIAFDLKHKKSKVVTFNPLLTPSALLDPKVLERRQRNLVQR